MAQNSGRPGPILAPDRPGISLPGGRGLPYNAAMRVLGIETSCDETGVAIYDDQAGLLAHALYSQVDLHRQYGGVVPELASRDHVRKLAPLVQQVLADSGASARQHQLDAVAYTAGPGLIGALLVGASFARSLAWGWGIPGLPIHHMEAHLLAPMLEETPPQMPFVALLVSGGHTLLVHVKALGDYQILGETLDDAAGEAFDKTAKMLGLSYPGGPALAALAREGDAERFAFPRPMTDRPGLDFSFSGLKTFCLNLHQKHPSPADAPDIAAGFEKAVADTLTIKCRRAMQATGAKTLVVAGGVGANQRLRAALLKDAKRHGWQAQYPRPEFCTDNGAMVAVAGLQRLQLETASGTPPNDLAIRARPRWPVDQAHASLAELTR